MENTPVPNYVSALLRTVGAIIGGWLVGKGYFTAEQSAEVGGAVLAVFAVAWSMYSKYKAHQALQAAIDAPAGYAK